MLADSNGSGTDARVNFYEHAKALGAETFEVSSLDEFAGALEKARASDKTAVIVTKVRAKDFTEGGAFWQVGVPEESPRTAVVEARASMDRGLKAQRKGV
jgi:3D-(3,5/4)-trihydroxycyclohexane-1,2-dione acylhydrolase (decyclizing)